MKRWQPRINHFPNKHDMYWIIIFDLYFLGKVEPFKFEQVMWADCKWDFLRYKFGNCFRTRKEAQQMAKKIKEMLKGGSR